MSIVAKLFGGGITKLVEAVGKAGDDMFTSDEERMAFQAKLSEYATKINLVEAANPSLFVAGWRPAVGWVCVFGLAYQFLVFPLLAWLSLNLGWVAPPSLDSVAIIGLLGGMLGTYGMRGREKKNGVARS